jgi:hypothetical protein
MDENLAFGNAYRYRDYVISAFNDDKPYDEFVREQIAGDLLPARDEQDRIENQIATGFLVIGPKMLAEDDPVKMEMDIVDEQLDTIGQAFLGLTLGCARCHDHKFDPVSMEDYYALAGILKSTKTMENFRVVARWQERTVATAAQLAELENARANVARQKADLERMVVAANRGLIDEINSRLADYLLAVADLNAARQVMLALQTPAADEGRSPQAIVVEAEKFVRGNVLVDFSAYGPDIGVIYNKGELPNYAEYEIDLSGRSACQIELRYAAAEARPVRMSINGRPMAESAADLATGSWHPDGQRWQVQGVFVFQAGKNTIRLERDGPFPHFDKLAILPRGWPERAHLKLPASPDELAAQRRLNAALLRQMAHQVSAAATSPLWSLWNRASTAARFADFVSQQTSASPIADLLLAEPPPATLAELARRYQKLYTATGLPLITAQFLFPPGWALPLSSELIAAVGAPAWRAVVPRQPEEAYPNDTRARLNDMRSNLARLEAALPILPEAMAVCDGQPQDLRMHIRGSHWTLGDEVPRRFPRILAGDQQAPIPRDRSGRLELAGWLTDPANPLAARVMVNRLWTWHFGEGIVRSPDNFGRLGQRPTNQPLLDWLARRFIESGWSIKAMHRLIMLSSAYQMSTHFDAHAAKADPENKLWWRFPRRRLDAEELRDALLALSGRLDPSPGGAPLNTENRKYVTGTASVNPTTYQSLRRSVYLPVIRSAVYEMFQAFDFADPSVLSGKRTATTVAPQALFMLNSPVVEEETRHLAARLLARDDLNDAARLRLAYDAIYARDPENRETDQGLEFLRQASDLWRKHASDQPRLRAWQSLCRVLLSANEFIYVE